MIQLTNAALVEPNYSSIKDFMVIFLHEYFLINP